MDKVENSDMWQFYSYHFSGGAKMLDSRVIPQANVLNDVIKVVEAVGQGAYTYQDLALAIGKHERQGRYYRLAAELIGMIKNDGTNHSKLTEKGTEFLSLGPNSRNLFLTNAVLSNKAILAVFDFILNNPRCSRLMIIDSLIQSNISPSVANRRISTIIRWLEDLGIIIETKQGINAIWQPTHDGFVEEIIEPEDDTISEPYTLVLKKLDEDWDGTITTGKNGSLIYEVSAEAREKAINNHQQLIKNMAKLLIAKDLIPKSNKNIDLYVNDSKEHIFEMKSCSSNNITRQIRRGISQLYEYRYQYKKPDAVLWLVLQTRPFGSNEWYIDYLTDDRKINVCWSNTKNSFECPRQCQSTLNQLLY